ncbi:MAG TPA: murein biosynthesis integral membrane protein MurJ [Acidimicrobiales bacterium]|nr:murein biosynthesis integral membrane protein MurJ [Acidimicrobiales bacterium]
MTAGDRPPPAPGSPSAAAPSGRRSSALVAGGILLSRVAGLARERAIAAHLGTGFAVDAFRAAARIPNLLQNLLGEGVLSASFIPVYARLLAEGEEEEAGRVAAAVAGLLAVVAGVLVVVGVVFARPLTAVLAAGYTGERFELTVILVRILTPGLGLLVLSAWCLGVLNSHRRFFLSYVAPVLWNVGQITVLVAVAARGLNQSSLAVALAWGALAGAALQLGIQLPAVRSLLRSLRPSLDARRPAVRTVLRRFGPAVAGRGVVQLSAYVDLFLASFLAVGAVAALTYAQVFYLLPISLFGMSVAAAELPELSRLGDAPTGAAAQARGPVTEALRARLHEGLGRVAFFVVPTAVAYLVLGDLVVATLLQTGRFDAGDTRLVWYVLAAFSLGLVATTASRLLQNGLYALGDTRTPARIAGLRVGLAAVLGAVLMLQLDRVVVDGPGLGGLDVAGALPALVPLPAELRDATGGALRLGAVGLALASATAAWLELGLLRRRLQARVGRLRLGGAQLLPVLAAGAVAGGVALVGRSLTTGLASPLALVIAGLPAALAYVATASALRVEEPAALLAAVRRRLR